jgi:alpha-D-xyloside xylohydrolase
MRLMPYLGRLAEQATEQGLPVMRPMVLEFPGDRTAATVDTQYMLGDALLVAPVFQADGRVEYYVPEGTWTRLLPGAGLPRTVSGPRWVTEEHGFDSLPLLVRQGTVLPVGGRDDRPDYAWADGVTLRLFELADGHDEVVTVPAGEGGSAATFRVRRSGDQVHVTSDDAPGDWAVEAGDQVARAHGPGEVAVSVPGINLSA